MTLEVYSIAPILHSRPSLVCQLSDITQDEAIERLKKAGVLAIAGTTESAIVLLGFNYEVSAFVRDLQRYGCPHRPQTRFTLGKLRALAAS